MRYLLFSCASARPVLSAGVVIAGFVLAVGPAVASVPPYVPAGSFTIPDPAAVFDDLPDGRLLSMTQTGLITVQLGLNSSNFALTPMGSLPAGLIPSFGPGFIRLSPDGSRLAVGDNGAANHLYILPMAALTPAGPTTPQTINVANYDAAWTDASTIYVNGSPDFATQPNLWRVNVTTNAAAAVVGGIGDGSGGVAARSGRVYTGIGFDSAGTLTGQVRSFDLATLNTASSPVSFSTGPLAAQANSASALDFDALGDLIIAGGGGVAVFDLTTAQRYDLPGLSASGFYSALFDNATNEILVRDFGSQTVLRYAVPAPSGLATIILAGLHARRRRRPPIKQRYTESLE